MANYFDSYCQEGNEFINTLARQLGHENDTDQVVRLLKSTLHSIRDRITIAESFHLISQLPMALKALYVEQWTYNESPLSYDSMEEFENQVETYQKKFGEQEFDWKSSTSELVAIVLSTLRERYLTDGQSIHIMDQMPAEIKEIF